jgi:hypothetical protein
MTMPEGYRWRRDKDGQGVWEYRGKVAVAGGGHLPVDCLWDGVAMDKTPGVCAILACRHRTRSRVSSAATAILPAAAAAPRRSGRRGPAASCPLAVAE